MKMERLDFENGQLIKSTYVKAYYVVSEIRLNKNKTNLFDTISRKLLKEKLFNS